MVIGSKVEINNPNLPKPISGKVFSINTKYRTCVVQADYTNQMYKFYITDNNGLRGHGVINHLTAKVI